MTNSEKIVNLLSCSYFYKEFTYSDLVFKNENKNEFQFSDIVVKFKNIALFIQIKEKNNSKLPAEKWFHNKVEKEANKQHKDSFSFLKNNKGLIFTNNENNKISIEELSDCEILPITIFDNKDISEYQKLHNSKSLNMCYNIFSYDDFEQVCKNLITPMEIIDYLKFRINFYTNYNSSIIIKDFENESQFISIQNEEDLISGYLWETFEETKNITGNCEFFRYIIGNYKSKIFLTDKDNYIKIIECFMDLSRKEIYELSERIKYELKNCSLGKFNNFRYMILNDFGILISSSEEFIKKRSSCILQDFKYCKKLNSAMFIEIIKKESLIEIMWLYTKFPYQYDENEEKYANEFEKLLPSSKLVTR